MPSILRRSVLTIAALLFASILSGCGGAVSGYASSFMDGLARSVMKQDDPQLVRDGAPAFLLVIDGLVEGRPNDVNYLLGAAKLYSAYNGAFIMSEDPERAMILSRKSRDYAFRAAAIVKPEFGRLRDKPFAEFEPAVMLFEENKEDVDLLFQLISSWAGYIQANSADWDAVADLAKVRALAERLVVLDDKYSYGSPHLIMALLHTILPEALGGHPEEGKKEFESALKISGGKFLQVQVLYARQYARAVFDRELHDRLLRQVMDTPADLVPELTLLNTLAKKEARRLLESSDAYFD